jgi:hypothetical protein
MGTRKNFLVFALFLNLLFFLGVTFFVSRQLAQGVDQTPMKSWLASATLQITSVMSQRQKHLEAQRRTLQDLKEVEKKKKFALMQRLTFVLEKNQNTVLEIIGDLKSFPFPMNLFDKNLLSFYFEKDDLVMSSFSDTQPHIVLSKPHPIAPIIQGLKAMGVDLSILENVDGERLVLFSSFTNPTAQELLAKVDFAAPATPLDMDLSTAMGSSFLITVAQQKHLALMVNIAQTEHLQQRAVFTLALPNYEILTTTEFMLYIWTFFCISLALTLLVYFKTKEK